MGGILAGLIASLAAVVKGFIVIGTQATPFIQAYVWSNGFGTKYANPATLPTAFGISIAVNPVSYAIAMYQNGSPWGIFYTFSTESGFGTRYPDLNESGHTELTFNHSGTVVVKKADAPRVWSNATGYGTQYSFPSYAPGTHTSFAFNSNSTAAIIGTSAFPYFVAYPWSNTLGYGTQYANPATLPTGSVYGVEFNKTSTAVAIGHSISPYAGVYAWSNATGFGTKYANPATLPTEVVVSSIFGPMENSVLFQQQAGSIFYAYAWSNATGFGTRYTNPVTLPASISQNMQFNSKKNAVAVTGSSGSYISTYPWSNTTGFGTKYANPSPALTSGARGLAFI